MSTAALRDYKNKWIKSKYRNDPVFRAKAHIHKANIKRRRKIEAVAYKGGECERCGGIFHPCVFDFHHTDPSTKEGQLTHMFQLKWETIKEELNKCLLLCANCHRLEHHKETEMNDVNTENTATPAVAAPAVKPAEVKQFVQNEKEVGDAGAPKAASPADVK